MQQPRTDSQYSWCQEFENCFFAIMKMKIFNLLLRATGEDFFETQVMQQPRADYRLDCCLQAWIGTPSVFAGFLK